VADFAVVVSRVDGLWEASQLPERLVEDFPGLLAALPQQVGDDGNAIGLVNVADEFFVAVRIVSNETRILLSDVTAAVAWDLAAEVVDYLGLERPGEDDLDDVWPAGDPSTRTPTRPCWSSRGASGSRTRTSGSSSRSSIDSGVWLSRGTATLYDRGRSAPYELTETLVPYFAAALANGPDGWSGHEVDMENIEDLDTLVETLRDYAPPSGGSVLFFLEEDDEYLAIVRVDGDADPRTFISDDRAVGTSAHAALVMEDVAPPEEADVDEDDDEGTRPDAEVAGDVEVLASFGISSQRLVELCATEGMLPADIVTAICEKAGCADVLDEVREG
jgi:putative tRNA adenosine deaminase-associated protein